MFFPGLVPGTGRNEVIMEERLYDLVFIVRPATPEEEIKKAEHAVELACSEKGAKIEKAEHWGTRCGFYGWPKDIFDRDIQAGR